MKNSNDGRKNEKHFSSKENLGVNGKGVKKMAVMTQSNQAAFIIDAAKVQEFVQSQEKTTEGYYDMIRKQSEQIQTQITHKEINDNEE